MRTICKFIDHKILFLKNYSARNYFFLQLDAFPNFKEDVSLLTLHEMVEIQNGYLLPALNDIHRCFAKHITTECQVCASVRLCVRASVCACVCVCV